METRRITITLSYPFEYQYLNYWAYIHSKPAATYAGQIIGARIEANIDQIEKELAIVAQAEGMTVEELKQHILNQKPKKGEQDEVI